MHGSLSYPPKLRYMRLPLKGQRGFFLLEHGEDDPHPHLNLYRLHSCGCAKSQTFKRRPGQFD